MAHRTRTYTTNTLLLALAAVATAACGDSGSGDNPDNAQAAGTGATTQSGGGTPGTGATTQSGGGTPGTGATTQSGGGTAAPTSGGSTQTVTPPGPTAGSGTTGQAGSSPTTGAGGAISPESGGTGGSTAGSSASGGSGGLSPQGGAPQGGSAGEASPPEPPPTVDCPSPDPSGESYASDETGVTFTLNAGVQRLEVYDKDIIHVQYAGGTALPDTESLSIVPAPGVPSFCVTEASGTVTLTTLRMKAKVDTSTGKVTFTDLDDALLLAEDGKSVRPTNVEGVDTNAIESTFVSPADEALFGLGQHQDGVTNRKGTRRHISNHNTEINIPVLVSNRGYGVFWDNYSTSDFYGDVDGNSKYRYTSEAGDLVDYYFFYGPSMDEVIARYRTATGGTPMFPKWAYGLFQSKDKYESQAELLRIKDGYRDNDIPVDCIVQDWDYWNPYSWGSHFMDESRYPDPEALVSEMHDANVHTMISIWPEYQYVADPLKAGDQDHYQALDAIGAIFPSGGSHHFYDVFNADARTLVYQQIYDRLLGNYGWDGIWADNTEPQPYPDAIDMRSVDTALGKGALYVNAYPLQHSKALYDGWRSIGPDGKRAFVLTRSAFAGQQRYAASTWSGDIDCDFETYARQIPAGLNYAAAGMPYWTTDIGGYWGHPGRVDWTTDESNELFTRWFQYGAFCPLFRIHGGGSRELFGDSWSETTRANLLKIDNLRYRLMPYIYSLAWKVTSEGYTIMRPLVFDYPHDTEVFGIGDQFLFGPALLVNPVTSAGATSRSVYLPAGDWYDFWTGEAQAGGERITADAPLSEIPLFVKAGAIVPMGPFIQHANESSDPLEIRLYPGQDGSFTLYQDQGDTYEYELGQYSTIVFTWNDTAKELTIGAMAGNTPGMLNTMTINIVLVGPQHGNGVELATPDATVAYDGSQLVVTAP